MGEKENQSNCRPVMSQNSLIYGQIYIEQSSKKKKFYNKKWYLITMVYPPFACIVHLHKSSWWRMWGTRRMQWFWGLKVVQLNGSNYCCRVMQSQKINIILYLFILLIIVHYDFFCIKFVGFFELMHQISFMFNTDFYGTLLILFPGWLPHSPHPNPIPD